MDTQFDRLLSVGLAVCLLFALGAGSNALDDAMSTDPDEVIDVDYGSLPFGEDDTGELRDAVTGDGGTAGDGDGTSSAPSNDPGEGDDASDASDESGNAEGEASGGEENRGEPGESDPSQPGEDPGQSGDEVGGSAGSSGDSGGGDSDEPGEASGPGEGEEEGTGPGERSLLDRLLALLAAVLPFVLLLVLLALAFAFRDQLLSRLGGDDAPESDSPEPVTYVANPEDDVSEAWYEMVRQLDLDQDVSKTPRECEQAATEAGVSPSIARTLTDLYEQVRYAGAPVTEERAREARNALENLRQDLHGGRRA